MKTSRQRTSRIASILPIPTPAAPVAPINLGADRATVAQPQPEEHELMLGDILRSSGSGKDYIVDRMLAGGRVSCTPLDPEPIRYERTDGSVVEYNTFKPLDIPAKSKAVLIERRGEAGVIKFIASKVARREVANSGNTTTRTKNMSKQTINGITLPTNPYDAKAWQEIHSGGTKDEIAGRIAAAFKDDKKKHRADPANALKYMDEKSDNNYQSEMKEAGLAVNIGKPFNAVPLDAPAVSKTETVAGVAGVPKVAPVVTLAPVGPETRSGSPTAGKGAAPAALVKSPKAGKSPAARAAAFIAKDAPKAGSKLRPLATGGKKPIAAPRGGLAVK